MIMIMITIHQPSLFLFFLFHFSLCPFHSAAACTDGTFSFEFVRKPRLVNDFGVLLLFKCQDKYREIDLDFGFIW